MGFLSSFLGILGFGIGLPLGLLVGFFFFIYSKPNEAEDPIVRPLNELDTSALEDLLPEIPLWVKNPDFDRVDWLNKVILEMWPYLSKAITGMIRSTAQPIFSEYIGKFQIETIEFESLSLGNLPPLLYGLKAYETNEKELVMETPVRWAGNPNITLVIKLLSLRITVQLVDLQIFSTARIALKPLVPSFPCFSNIVVSLMEKPHVDFGMKILGGDLMSIPGLYRFVQVLHRLAIKKPVGILRVNVVRAHKLLKKDLLGASDPYVKLSLTGEGLSAKKTTVKKKTLNPEWNENFKLVVKDPQSQVLRLQVFDWDKVGGHDRLGVQLIPLKLLTPYETKEFTLDLLKDTNISDSQDKKRRGQIEAELTFVPFKENNLKFSGPLVVYGRKESSDDKPSDDGALSGAGLLSVMLQGAEEVEGQSHNNPYALVLFRGERKKTKMIKRTRNPLWNDEFQFMLEEPPLHERIYVEVFSKRSRISFLSKESLGHVEINLSDVVSNGRINEKYHLINSKNGTIHVEMRWTTV
ncbi:Extended synaptotagmin-2 [Morus notabilis]|uniref:Extended synaptotagmin-2 n=1 Tax=Morus notabilis TaxID=981085 RepID=W9R7T4_9ROSA|nr:Extended synaptotagmin-2 [Morus notabilis]